MSAAPGNPPVILVLGPGGLATARRIRDALDGAAIHGLAGRVDADFETFESFAAHAAALFAGGTPVLGICAAGTLIRVLAPHLRDKHAEPPVVAVAEDGSAVVPLLGGHHGGNDLARAIAASLGVQPAITTAGDLRFGIALDTPPAGWRLANPADAKPFMAELLAGATVWLENDAPWLAESTLPIADTGALAITVTDRLQDGDPAHLVYHPATLAVGVGCERGVAPAEVLALVRETLAEAGLAEGAVAGVFSLDLKSDEAAIHALADALDVPARFFDAPTLEAETPRLANPSDIVFAEVGAHGVAEAAALAAAGRDAALIVPKRKSRRATCAVARASGLVDIAAAGRPRGRLAVVGIGPGTPDWRTPEVNREIATASDLVGYGLYLDLLGPLAQGKTRHDYGLGEEQARVRHALDLAADGRRVALVCSGDAGIYAMAALVFEELENQSRADWNRVAVSVAPGVSAMQAAAARAGAPLGHDFCAISLSDLLTPWAAIERRLRAAADGDFVVAFYNPVSGRRRHQLARAREILLAHRPPETPVFLARNLGRDGEACRIVTLEGLTVEMVDMLTLVIVGSSATRCVDSGGGVRVYTPRGYADKTPADGTEGGRGMKVHFIGAGPGAADLITVRGRDLIARCPVCLYAGSLVPEEVIAVAPQGARVIDTSALTLDEIIAEIQAAAEAGHDVARVHSGDPSLYGATAEQMRRLDALGIAYDITPGVPAFAAAAAALGVELTLPEISQSVILTRTAMKSSPMPDGESLARLGTSGATLAIHLSVRNLRQVTADLIPHYGADCPAVVVYRASWPDERIIRGTLADIRGKVREAKITRTALVLVGRVLDASDHAESRLYAPTHVHILRPRCKA